MASNKENDNKLENEKADTNQDYTDLKTPDTDEEQNAGEPKTSEGKDAPDDNNTANDAGSTDSEQQSETSNTDNKDASNTKGKKGSRRKSQKNESEAEPRVFYVEGYGNVNGCKTQAEAEEKARKLIEQARQ